MCTKPPFPLTLVCTILVKCLVVSLHAYVSTTLCLVTSLWSHFLSLHQPASSGPGPQGQPPLPSPFCQDCVTSHSPHRRLLGHSVRPVVSLPSSKALCTVKAVSCAVASMYDFGRNVFVFFSLWLCRKQFSFSQTIFL